MAFPSNVEESRVDRALRSSHAASIRVELWSDGNMQTTAAPFDAGDVIDQLGTDNIGIGVRRSITLSVKPIPKWVRWLAMPGLELRPYRGVILGDDTIVEYPLGRFPIKAPEQNVPAIGITLKSDDYYTWVTDANLTVPIQAPKGFVRDAIAWLMSSVGLFNVDIRTSTELQTTDVWFTKTRHDAVVDLAQSIGVEVFMDRNGVPVIAPSRALDATDPSGSLVGLAEGYKRTPNWDKVYNVVSAKSSMSGATFPPADVGITWDGSPASPMNIGNRQHPLRRVYLYSSPLLATYEQALAAAYTILPRVSAPAETYAFSGIPDPRIDAGDSILIPTVTGGFKVAQVASVTHPLTPDGRQKIVTIASNLTTSDIGSIYIESPYADSYTDAFGFTI